MNVEIQPYFAEGERYPALIGVRVEGDEYETAYVSKGELADALAENAKLRELVLCLLTCSSDRGDACDKCPVNGGSGIWDFEDFCDSLLDRMRELGVEAG